ncbi:MAG TPA: Fe-S cluster assembly protein SufB, partial [Candidatus Hydrogenedentes bacterium]|nr:Fe-S cluster assembly protein SufB [Candidatus Hydrogenedentota bacterium]
MSDPTRENSFPAGASRSDQSTRELEEIAAGGYRYGWTTDIETEIFPKGLNEDIIRELSRRKNEPEWMTAWRLKAYRAWQGMEEPRWAKVTYKTPDFQDISYYAAPKKKPEKKSLDEVDPKLLETFEKPGIPLEEQKRLSGVAVDAVFDSVSVATTHREILGRMGIIFCPISE